MTVTLRRVEARGQDRRALETFLLSNSFPFHAIARPCAAQVAENIDAGAWDDADTETFWIESEHDPFAGVVRLQDIRDPTVMLDLRLAEHHRGHGLGTAALRAVTDYLFRARPDAHRFEGATREDNVAMRRTFDRNGWVQEAHYRDGWPMPDAEPMASVGYSTLRRDWAAGTRTLVPAFTTEPAQG